MTWFFHNWQEVVDLIWSHLGLSVPAILLSIVIAVPIGRLGYLRPRIGAPVLSIATLAYAIPALPLLLIVPVVFGFPLRSWQTMVTALTLYGVALLVRTATDAFASVDTQLREASIAVGFSPHRLFWSVDLPLAIPVLVSGIRVTTVSTISLVTIGALIGVPSLGSLLTDGFQRGIAGEVWTGVIATTLLALVLDAAILFVGRIATPWRRKTRSLKPSSQAETAEQRAT